MFIDEAVNQFSKAYQKRYLNKTNSYEGILKLLESLEEKGIKIAVNSNKRGDYTSALVINIFHSSHGPQCMENVKVKGFLRNQIQAQIRNRRFDETSKRRNFIY